VRTDSPRDSQNVMWNRLRIALWLAFEHLRIFVHIQYIQLPQPATGENSGPLLSQANSTSANTGPTFSAGDRDGDETPVTAGTPQTSGPSSNPPLTTCVNSAHAIIKLAEEFFAITPAPYGALLSLQAGGLFLSCIVLLIATWSEDLSLKKQESGMAHDEREPPSSRSDEERGHRQTQHGKDLMKGVVQCLDLIKRAEEYWQPAGKAWCVDLSGYICTWASSLRLDAGTSSTSWRSMASHGQMQKSPMSPRLNRQQHRAKAIAASQPHSIGSSVRSFRTTRTSTDTRRRSHLTLEPLHRISLPPPPLHNQVAMRWHIVVLYQSRRTWRKVWLRTRVPLIMG